MSQFFVSGGQSIGASASASDEQYEKATYGMGKRTDAETEAPILWPPDAKN